MSETCFGISIDREIHSSTHLLKNNPKSENRKKLIILFSEIIHAFYGFDISNFKFPTFLFLFQKKKKLKDAFFHLSAKVISRSLKMNLRLNEKFIEMRT